MPRQTRSIKGEVVDFDLLEVKRSIGEKPVSADVKNREDFVYSKRKRGSKRAVQQMIQNQEAATEVGKVSPKVEKKSKIEPKKATAKKKVAAKKATAKKKVAPNKRKIIKKN